MASAKTILALVDRTALPKIISKDTPRSASWATALEREVV